MPVLPPIEWPTQDEISQVQTTLWSATPENFMGLKMSPMNVSDYMTSVEVVKWDEYGTVSGMAAPYKYGAPVRRANLPTVKTRTEVSRPFRETVTLDEESLLKLRGLGAESRMRAAKGLIIKAMSTMYIRHKTRQEWMFWSACRGSVAVADDGIQWSVSYGTPSATTVGTLWSVTASANPVKDIQDECLKFRGVGGGKPTLYINQKVANYLSQNAAVRALVTGSGYVGQIGNEQITGLLVTLIGGLAGIVIYDEGYDASGTFTPFIADTEAFLIAPGLNGEKTMEFASTPCILNGGIDNPRPGYYAFIDDDDLTSGVPKVDCITGWTGIPVIYHPSRIRRMVVAS